MSDKILILGKGYVGSRLQEELGCAISDKKILSFKDADAEVKKFKPDILINCIGHVGRNVDECEQDIDRSLMVNSFIPLILAEAAIRNNIRLIHISSGCIYHYDYDLDKPIEEDMTPDFFELFYSRTKIYSEQPLTSLSSKYPVLIVRIRVPLDGRPHPRNLLTKLISYKKVINAPNSVTYIPDFIAALKHLIKIKASVVYNIVNKGPLVYADLMDTYKTLKPDFNYNVMDYKAMNAVRTNLVLSVDKLERSGFKMRGIKEVLEECVAEYVKY